MCRLSDKVVGLWVKEIGIHEHEQEQIDNLKALLSTMDHVEVVRTFVVRDMANGVGKAHVLRRYNITAGEYRGIGIKAGIFKRTRF